MKLTVKEAAQLLGATESDVYRWVKQQAIPCHRVNDSYRFHKAELLEWATVRGIRVDPEAFSASRRSVDQDASWLVAALRFGRVYHDVEGCDRESALSAIVSRMPLANDADRELLFNVLLAREALGSTGIGEGIAIPHVRSPVVLPTDQPAITLCFLAQPIDFAAIDESPVHTFFSMVTTTIRSHLHLLSRLSAALQDPGFRKAVAERAPEEIILAEAERVDMAVDTARGG